MNPREAVENVVCSMHGTRLGPMAADGGHEVHAAGRGAGNRHPALTLRPLDDIAHYSVTTTLAIIPTSICPGTRQAK